MEYISKNNISCKAILYKNVEHSDEFIRQLFNEFYRVIIEKIDRNPFYVQKILTVDDNNNISEPIYLQKDSYFVKTEDPNVGINGYLIVPKDLFEFLFKEKE